tara:strand:- start:585 stop:800 length:216 start_codon:yes stop_codon:yes gene_type:complete
MALNRFEGSNDLEGVQAFYLDIINFRSISNQLALDYDVQHQSPQLLLIRANECIYNASHNSISIDAIKAFL